MRVNWRRLAGFAAVFGCSCALQAAPAPLSPYFDTLNTNSVSPFCVQVQSVIPGSPGAQAGLLPGDRIVGVDGKRIRDVREYRTILQCYADRKELTLTVQRGSELTALKLSDLPEDRITGCILDNDPPQNVWEVLTARCGIQPTDVFKREEKQEPQDPLGNLMQDFAVVQPVNLGRPDVGEVLSLPPRAKDALWRLGAKRTEASRLWVLDFLGVFNAMIVENFAQARKLMATQRLRAAAPEPFLGELLSFYAKVAASPPSRARGIPLQSYGVDPLYFALCYPYPIVPERRTDWFAFNREFQQQFDRATSGDVTLTDELGRISEQFHAPPGASRGEQYHGFVLSALISMHHHGGWPYRATMLQNGSTAPGLYAELRQNAEAHPDKKVSRAFSLLVPSLKFEDMDVFSNAYTTLCEAGTREMATANRIIDSAVSWSRWDRGTMLAKRDAIERQFGYPEVYDVLSKMCPLLSKRAAKGYYVREKQWIDGLSVWCSLNLDLIAKALIENRPAPAISTEGHKQVIAAPPPAPNPAVGGQARSVGGSSAPVVEPAALTSLRSAFTNAWQRYDKEYATSVAAWPDQYERELEALRKSLQAAGNLDGVLAVKVEIDRFGVDGALPPKAVVAAPPELRALQRRHLESRTKPELQRGRKRLALVDDYVGRLTTMQRTLTTAGKLEQAVQVSSEIKRAQALPELAEARAAVAPAQEAAGVTPPRPAAPALTARMDLSDGLIAHYPLNGSARDVSGNGHHGILKGAPKWAAGVNGSAIAMQNSNAWIELPRHPLNPRTNAWSVSVWVKMPPGAVQRNSQILVVANRYGSGGGANWCQISGAITGANVEVPGRLMFAMRSNQQNSQTMCVSPVKTDDGMWHHLAAVRRTRTELDFWIDGALTQSISNAQLNDVNVKARDDWGQLDANAQAYLGYQPTGTGSWFDGSMDEVRFYNRALTPAEIEDLAKRRHFAPATAGAE